MASTVADAIGGGAWRPSAPPFLVHGQDPSPVGSGTALTAGRLPGPVPVLPAGSTTDRVGPVPALMTGNALCFPCFLCYPFATTAWRVVAVSVFTVSATGSSGRSARREVGRRSSTGTLRIGRMSPVPGIPGDDGTGTVTGRHGDRHG